MTAPNTQAAFLDWLDSPTTTGVVQDPRLSAGDRDKLAAGLAAIAAIAEPVAPAEMARRERLCTAAIATMTGKPKRKPRKLAATVTPDGMPNGAALTAGQVRDALTELIDPSVYAVTFNGEGGCALPASIIVAADYIAERNPRTTRGAAILSAMLGAYTEALTAESEAGHLASNARNGYTFAAWWDTYSVDATGRKYLRIVRHTSAGGPGAQAGGPGRSVHLFVEISTGRLWKADGWKGVETNYPRGWLGAAIATRDSRPALCGLSGPVYSAGH